MRFHHIGIATENIEEMIIHLNKILEISEISDMIFDPLQNANLCMLNLSGGVQIELISGEVVAGLIKKRNYLYHTCYSVDNIEESIKSLQDEGYLLISEPKKAILFEGERVAFLSGKLGIIEILEENNSLSG